MLFHRVKIDNIQLIYYILHIYIYDKYIHIYISYLHYTYDIYTEENSFKEFVEVCRRFVKSPIITTTIFSNVFTFIIYTLTFKKCKKKEYKDYMYISISISIYLPISIYLYICAYSEDRIFVLIVRNDIHILNNDGDISGNEIK